MVEHLHDYPIIILDPAGDVVSWNMGAERIGSYEEEEIIGKHFGRLFIREDVQAARPEQE